MKVHDIVKLNPEIFPENKRFNPTFQAGALNYPAKMLMYEFRVVSEIKDEYHGEMLYVTMYDTENVERGNFYLRKQDCIPKE